MIFREKATVEVVSTEKSVILSRSAKINQRVITGRSLLTTPSLVQKVGTEIALRRRQLFTSAASSEK